MYHLNHSVRKPRYLWLFTAIVSVTANAGSIEYPDNPFQDGETLTSSKLNNTFNMIKGAVNNNDTIKQGLINNTCTNTQAIQTIAPDGTVVCNNISTGGGYTDQQARDAMGIINNVGPGNSYNHDRFDPGAKNNVGAGNPLNHDRFDPGSKDNVGAGNPLNHDRYTNVDAVAAVKASDGINSGLDADLLDGMDSSAFVQSNQTCTSGSLVGIDANGAITCQVASTVTTKILAASNLLPTTYSDITFITVDAPAAGTVHVSATGTMQLTNKLAGTFASIYVGLSSTSNGTPAAGNRTRFFANAATSAGGYEIPYTVQAVFSVAAGVNTYYLVALENGQSGEGTLLDNQIVATFHKN